MNEFIIDATDEAIINAYINSFYTESNCKSGDFFDEISLLEMYLFKSHIKKLYAHYIDIARKGYVGI